MGKRKIYDPYAELLGKLNRSGIRYVVIGMSGINYYASGARETFATQDFDIFIKPTVENVKKAVLTLKKLKFNLAADGAVLEHTTINKIVRQKNTILAIDYYGVTFEFILAVSGYTFDQMEKDAIIFSVQKIPVKVARLNKLLRSKKIAARPKDKLFLKRYEILLRDKAAQ